MGAAVTRQPLASGGPGHNLRVRPQRPARLASSLWAWIAHYGAVRRRIAVTHSIGLMGFADAEREVAQAAHEGIRTFKIKVGVDPDRDVPMVRRVRDTVGRRRRSYGKRW